MTARTWHNRLRAVLGVLAIAALSAGCSASTELPSGSLRIGPGGEELNCPDPGVRHARALGAVWVKNLGESPIRIRKVEPVAPVDVEVDGVFLVPDGGKWYSVAADVPPSVAQDDDWSADAWARRVPLQEAVLEPGELWQIVQVMRTLSDEASFEATRVEYDEDGVRRAGQDRTAMYIMGDARCLS
ncbi:hypothetical protein [Cellulomonas gilvus]|uniref:Lipoprotein n=1 Tax=Cellulomonas gilvus (strain ATCC 13127 / NRRL B-14078) TaxID=593907 RepID=F8A3F7_CELGA|nr:hypothetical protein [Cellulomonas gilvus]AEI10721.1 hypothetical protein Celgi_0193 [Cellulomonas gilvus ATCC 13127]